MIDTQQLAAMVAQNPQMQQASDQMEQEFMQRGISPEAVAEVIKTLEFVLANPDRYQEVLQAAIQRGYVEPGDLPEEFNEQLLLIMLAALHDVAARMSQQQQPEPPPQQFAYGGLAQVAAMGRMGDTMLAHVNPREAAVLQAMGGSGTVNPNTGLREFKGGGLLNTIIKVAVPIAANVMFPGMGLVGSALLGGATSALTGGNFAQGAIMGGLGAGLGGAVGGGANSLTQSLGGGALSGATQNLIGSSVVGGLGSMAQGKGFAEGAVTGGLGSYVGGKIGGLGNESTAFGRALTEGGKTFGNAMTAGYSPQEALLSGVVSGGINAYNFKPPAGRVPGAEDSMDWKETPTGLQQLGSDMQPGDLARNMDTGELYMPQGAAGAAPSASGSTGFGFNKDTGSALMGLGALGAMGSLGAMPQEVAPEIQKLSPSQQEYFNRPNQYWDWNKLMTAAQQQNMPLSQYLATNWQSVTAGDYNKPTQEPVKMAQGGLSMVRLAQGGGTGRDDTIPARLSDGEYVMDAETVAMLGDGSTRAGAAKFDEMRKKLREHKGKALARGKISANAKSPLNYIAEAA